MCRNRLDQRQLSTQQICGQAAPSKSIPSIALSQRLLCHKYNHHNNTRPADLTHLQHTHHMGLPSHDLTPPFLQSTLAPAMVPRRCQTNNVSCRVHQAQRPNAQAHPPPSLRPNPNHHKAQTSDFPPHTTTVETANTDLAHPQQPWEQARHPAHPPYQAQLQRLLSIVLLQEQVAVRLRPHDLARGRRLDLATFQAGSRLR